MMTVMKVYERLFALYQLTAQRPNLFDKGLAINVR
jgi:hypothetical protein